MPGLRLGRPLSVVPAGVGEDTPNGSENFDSPPKTPQVLKKCKDYRLVSAVPKFI